jgi:uncharacterized protein
MDDDGLLPRIAAVLARHPVLFAYVFGSAARGDAGPTSDVDVAVRFRDEVSERQRLDRCLDVGVDLARELGTEVDVVDLEQAPLRLAGRILTERVVVIGHDEPARVRYEVELFPRYIDFEHHARLLDQELLAATAAGER